MVRIDRREAQALIPTMSNCRAISDSPKFLLARSSFCPPSWKRCTTASAKSTWLHTTKGKMCKEKRILYKLSALLIVTIAFASNVSAAAFMGLGDLPGGSVFSMATGISADGSTVVGLSTSSGSGTEAFMWTHLGGMVGLGDLPGGGNDSRANGVSADGSTVVGEGRSSRGDEAFVWTQPSGMVGLGDQTTSFSRSSAYAVSADGGTVVGQFVAANNAEAFRWTQSTGVVTLGDLPPSNSSGSSAYGVSADGNVVVGTGTGSSGNEAFRWIESERMVSLGDLPGGTSLSNAYAVSADGGTIVGSSRSSRGSEAYRWTQSEGMVGLGDLLGGVFQSVAFGVSVDGGVVVGRGAIAAIANEAFIWDATNGMRSLEDVLLLAGLDLTGWSLIEARGVSADGSTVVGYGMHNGVTEAFIASIAATISPAIPSPAPIWLFVSNFAAYRLVEHRNQKT